MIKITKANGKVVELNLKESLTALGYNSTEITTLTEEQLEDEFVEYVTDYGLDSPILDCITENLLRKELNNEKI